MTPIRYAFCSLLSITVLAVTLLRHVDAQSPTGDANLTLEEIVRLSQTGIPEELIITKIKKNGKAFDLSRQELVDLKKLGVSETVIKYLLDPSQPYTPPAPTNAPGAASASKSNDAKKYPADPGAAKIPSDPGLYLFLSNTSSKIDIKLLLGMEVGKPSKKKKQKTIAYLVGPAAKTRIRNPAPLFYARLPEGTEIEQLVLVVLLPKEDRREVDVEELRPEVTRSFDSLEVAPRLFKITPAKLTPGEYLFLVVGSADPSKRIQGKGYDFAIEESRHNGSSTP